MFLFMQDWENLPAAEFGGGGRQGNEMLQWIVMVPEHIIRQLDVLEDDKPLDLREYISEC